MFDKLVKRNFLKALNKIDYGQIIIKTPEGETVQVNGSHKGYSIYVELHDWRVIANLIIKGDVGFAADYRDGYFTTDNLYDLICFGLQNEHLFQHYAHGSLWFKLLSKLLYLTRCNTLKGSKRNIQAHYDLGNEFYKLWLDSSMTYSAAIFDYEGQDLTEAQHKKYDRILDKIGNKPGSILEIGCGWGGFAERAFLRKHQVKGITLSNEQASYAQQRLKDTDVKIEIEDYRHQTGSYDYIVSIEMLEAVGMRYWPVYFAKLKQLLKPGGKILLQTITISDDLFRSYVKQSDMIRTFIFPGGMLPSERSLEQELDKCGLRCSEIFRFGKDYATTLQIWLTQFKHKLELIAQLGFNDEFIRMWEFYLSACSAGFISERINVVQMEIVHA